MQKKTREITTISNLGPGRAGVPAYGGADHAVGEHEAILQFETARLMVLSYRRRNRKEAAVVPCYWCRSQRRNCFRPEVSYGVREHLRLGKR
jgi:hypothetical protein